jgi:SAM-dependent methyltransferase
MVPLERRFCRPQGEHMTLEHVARRIASRIFRGCNNALYLIKGAPDGLPIPPLKLRAAAWPQNAHIHTFLQGERQAQYFLEVLASLGASPKEFRAILDFGCGPGRVIRQFYRLHDLIPNARIYGTDINPDCIDWCRRKLAFAVFELSDALPPLPYLDEQFGFIYALSVFTHLTLQQQQSWIAELSRILKPGGYLLITTLGESFLHNLGRDDQRKFKAGELVVVGEEFAGDPSAYGRCGAYHPPGYIERKLAKGFELARFVAVGAVRPGSHGAMDQDQYFLRKPIGRS